MSSFILGKKHIDTLLTAALLADNGRGLYVYHENDGTHVVPLTVDRWGAMLVAENVKSVRGRYDDIEPDLDNAPGPVENGFAVRAYNQGEYQFARTGEDLHPAVVLNALLCYEYQSDDHDGLQASMAGAFCRYLKDDLIRRLPEGAGTWEIG